MKTDEIKKQFATICEDFLFNAELDEKTFDRQVDDNLDHELAKIATPWDEVSDEKKEDATEIADYEATMDSFGIHVKLYSVYDEGYHWFVFRHILNI